MLLYLAEIINAPVFTRRRRSMLLYLPEMINAPVFMINSPVFTRDDPLINAPVFTRDDQCSCIYQ